MPLYSALLLTVCVDIALTSYTISTANRLTTQTSGRQEEEVELTESHLMQRKSKRRAAAARKTAQETQ